MAKRFDRSQYVQKFRTNRAAALHSGLRFSLLFLFCLAGALFLWGPTRWIVEAVEKFSAFQNIKLPELSSAQEKAAESLDVTGGNLLREEDPAA